MVDSSWKRLKGGRNKYNNVKMMVDGMTFDSKAEADYYSQLKIRQRAGEILKFERQFSFEIVPPFTDATGYRHRPVTYRADFVVYYEGHTEIVDVKGFATREFTLKWKMLKWRYGQQGTGYTFRIVTPDEI